MIGDLAARLTRKSRSNFYYAFLALPKPRRDALYAVYALVMHDADPFHVALLASTAVVLVASVALAGAGVDMAACLVVLTLAPVITVVGFELLGHRHLAARRAVHDRYRGAPETLP